MRITVDFVLQSKIKILTITRCLYLRWPSFLWNRVELIILICLYVQGGEYCTSVKGGEINHFNTITRGIESTRFWNIQYYLIKIQNILWQNTHYTTLLFYNLPVYVVLCNCSVLSVVSVKNEHYKQNQKNKQKKTKKMHTTRFCLRKIVSAVLLLYMSVFRNSFYINHRLLNLPIRGT